MTKTWTPEDVAGYSDPTKAFAEYCQQVMGVPWPTLKDLTILRRRCKEFFAHYPDCDWFTLCRVAQWCRARKRRVPRVWMVIDEFRRAWAAGALPELDPADRQDRSLERQIEDALEAESRPDWRRRLLTTRGVDARREAFAEWKTACSSSSL